jgi:hypothetical protein
VLVVVVVVNPDYAWLVDFHPGFVHFLGDSEGTYFVRAVRTAE